MPRSNLYQKSGATFAFNPWDIIALVIILCLFVLLGWGATQMSKPFDVGQQIPISLNPMELPFYALQSISRILIALFISLVFTFIVGTLAARNKHAERILIPAIDILQSVPVLGYLSITITAFIALFPGSLLGPTFCAIFVIFTAQVWNMTLGFYQSLRIIPADLMEVARMFNLTPWQRFWRIEVPFAMPNLLWNMMMSMSQSWVFLMYSEAISVANQNIRLPGIGSYIALAIQNANLRAIIYAVIAMFVVIILYDQLMFRPLLKWAEKFNLDPISDRKPTRMWFTSLLQRTHVVKYLGEKVSVWGDAFINLRWSKRIYQEKLKQESKMGTLLIVLMYVAFFAILIFGGILFVKFIASELGVPDIIHAVLLGLASMGRVMATVIISTIIWVPIGVWVGMRPRAAQIVQPVVQFLASFPANLIYPFAVLLIVKFHLDANLWVTVLMILGAQWYILFNVIAGTMNIPKDIYYAANNFGVHGWLWWKRVIFPGIFPYYLTGAITAAGGAWNLTIVAELVTWGSHTIETFGLGAYITQYTTSGDFQRIALGIGVMCILVLICNWLIWRPLYNLAEARFKMS
jgi:NitT/TauT family transport system permease protein